MLLTYKYRIYPNRKQMERIGHSFALCKKAYNELLSLNIDAYKKTKKSLTKYDFNNHLKGKSKNIHSQVLQNVSDRVAKAFQNFYRRVKDKKCKKKGFPRFKQKVKSITYPQSGFKLKKRLYCSKIGNIPIKLHRNLKGKVKTLTIKQNKANQYYACFSVEKENKIIKHKSTNKIGIDLGLNNFIALSNGNKVNNPKYLRNSEIRLKRLQRRLSRKKKGSRNRKRFILRLAKLHNKIQNQRTDFLHKLSYGITKSYSLIAIENLNINGMVKNRHLSKSISDASWNTFIQMLSYKAVTCGGQLVKVDPRNTTKECSRCKNKIEMPLTKRAFNCNKCGLKLDRDVNAALNIYSRAGQARTHTPVDRFASVGTFLKNKTSLKKGSIGKEKISKLEEAGTICIKNNLDNFKG